MRDLQERFQFANLIGAWPTRNALRLKSLSPAQPSRGPALQSDTREAGRRRVGRAAAASGPRSPLPPSADTVARSRELNCKKQSLGRGRRAGFACNPETVKDCRAPSSNGYGQPPDATCVRSYVPLQSRPAANLLSEVFIETFLLPCAGPQRRAIGLDPPAPTPRP